MKQLFVDILTRMTPYSINGSTVCYKIKNGDDTTYIDIDWRYINPNNVPKLEYILPFSKRFNNFTWDRTVEYTQKIYTLTISGNTYFIDFNPVEICEIDRIVYNIFSTYQTNKIKEIQTELRKMVLDSEKTDAQRFDEAQERVVEGKDE